MFLGKTGEILQRNGPQQKIPCKVFWDSAQQIFSLAIESQDILQNPVDFVKIPDPKSVAKRRALTEEEQR